MKTAEITCTGSHGAVLLRAELCLCAPNQQGVRIGGQLSATTQNLGNTHLPILFPQVWAGRWHHLERPRAGYRPSANSRPRCARRGVGMLTAIARFTDRGGMPPCRKVADRHLGAGRYMTPVGPTFKVGDNGADRDTTTCQCCQVCRL